MLIVQRRRVGVLWTPADISTALWLDAADASTVTTVSGNVSQWNDKSGNGRNATQATAGNRPVYTAGALNNLNVIEFNPAINSFQRLSFPRIQNIGHVFFVAKKNNVNDSEIVLRDGGDAGTTQDLRGVLLSASTGSNFLVQQLTGSLSTATRNNWHIAEVRTDGTNASLGINGTRTTNADADLMSASDIGFYHVNQSAFRGQFAELIISLTALNDTTRQRIEGYLAHKWGLTANLPNDHPYKTAAPTV